MSKFTTTLKGLMALALGSFALSASALPTISTAPADGQFDANTVWYYWDAPINGQGYVAYLDDYRTSAGTQFILDNVIKPTADGGLWCIAGDETNGYSLYCKAEPTKIFGVQIKTADSEGGAAESNLYDISSVPDDVNTTFIIENSNKGEGYYTLKLTKTSETTVLNNRSNKLGLWVGADNYGGYPNDNGSAFRFRTEDEIASALAAAKTENTALLNNIKSFYHNQSVVQQAITDINNATSVESVNSYAEKIIAGLNNKVVYLIHQARQKAGKPAYVAVKDINTVNTVAEPCTYAKWKFERDGSTANFKLRNIASDLYLSASNSGIATDNNEFIASFVAATNTDNSTGTRLKFHNNENCYFFDEADGNINQVDQTTLIPDGATTTINADLLSFSIEPASVGSVRDITDGYYVIRCNRGLTGSTYSNYNYPGSLLGVYTTDRRIARDNADYFNGPHLQTYSFRSIWHIVPQEGGGFHINSLISETDQGEMGLTLNAGVRNIVTLTNSPSTIYIRSAAEWTYTGGTSLIPNGMALSSSPNNTSESNCIDVSNSALKLNADHTGFVSDNTCVNADYPIKGNEWRPNGDANRTFNIGTVFYIERVSDQDVATARAQFLDYVNGKRSFETMKNVLSPEEQEAVLRGKTVKDPNVTSIAEGNAWLSEVNEDGKVSSTYAVEMLEGKLVRFSNRKYDGFNIVENGENKLTTRDNNTSALDCTWSIEVVNAPLRQVKLRNYKTNRYVGSCPTEDNTLFATVENDDDAATFTLRRQPSIDYSKFFLTLICPNSNDNENRQKNAMHRNGSGNIVRWFASTAPSHWTMLDIDDADIDIELDVKANATSGTIEFCAPENGTLTLTEGLGAHHLITAVAAPVDEEIAPAAEAAAVTFGKDDILEADGKFTLDATQLLNKGKHNISIPAGMFTINGKLSPALSTEIDVKDTTTAISNIKAENVKSDAVIYDLQGRRVSKASKGVYIINGVKTLVK